MYLFPSDLFYLLVYICIALTSYTLHLWFKKIQRKGQASPLFVGPPTRLFFGNELEFLFTKNDIASVLFNYAKKYGSRYSLHLGGELYLVLSNAEDAEEVLGSLKYVEKGFNFRKSFGRIFGNGTFSAEAHVWKKNRKALQFSFKKNVLENYTDVMNEETDKLIESFGKLAEAEETFDAIEHIAHIPFSIFCKTLLDSNIEVPKNKHVAFNESCSKHLEDCFERLFLPYVVTACKSFINRNKFIDIKKKMSIMCTVLDEEGKLERNTNVYDEKDVKTFRKFIYCLLDYARSGQDVLDDIISYSVGGTETLGITLSFTLLMLGIHQDIQKKVYEELHEIFRGEYRDVTANDMKKMVYLDQVIKETQRLYPLLPFLFRYAPENVYLDNCTIPAGTNLIINVYDIQHDARYYTKPEEFNPDRFSPEKSLEIPKGCFLPFSMGPRNCIGKAFAIHEMKIICSKILYTFHVHTDVKKENIKLGCRFIMSTVDGFKISVSKRK